MKFALLVVLSAAVLLGVSDAICPNDCSGHGKCGANDMCTCHTRPDRVTPAWTGGDCSLRTCPKGNAWFDIPSSDNTAHAAVECSARGKCDRDTGICGCYDGYSGIACERRACPSDCNGRGMCKTQKDLANDAGKTYTAVWDAVKSLGCKCDPGFRGPDCSQIECPSGPDVLLGEGSEVGRDCGGRGRCNYETGICECFDGYFGSGCNQQVSISSRG